MSYIDALPSLSPPFNTRDKFFQDEIKESLSAFSEYGSPLHDFAPDT